MAYDAGWVEGFRRRLDYAWVMRQPYTSSALFHFVGRAAPADDDRNCETLLKILRSGCISFPPHDKAGHGPRSVTVRPDASLLDEQLISPHITCFADIPAESLGPHVSRYGRFGLSFARAELLKWGARPVAYVPTFKEDWDGIFGRTMLRDLEAIYKGFRAHYAERIDDQAEGISVSLAELLDPAKAPRGMGKIPKDEQQLLRALKRILEMDLLAYIKPFDADLPEDHQDNFYMEREWRLVGQWPFKLEDIVHIHAAPLHRTRIQSEFPALQGRIIDVSWP